MKILLTAVLFAFAPLAAHAAPRVDRIDVAEYGIYNTITSSYVVDDLGIRENQESDVRLMQRTTRVPARAGLAFGMKFTPAGAPHGAPVEVRKVIIFPKGGLRAKGKSPLTLIDHTSVLAIGEETFSDYKFDEPWEMVPGPWTFQFWVDGRKLAEKTFIIVTDDGPPVS